MSIRWRFSNRNLRCVIRSQLFLFPYAETAMAKLVIRAPWKMIRFNSEFAGIPPVLTAAEFALVSFLSDRDSTAIVCNIISLAVDRK